MKRIGPKRGRKPVCENDTTLNYGRAVTPVTSGCANLQHPVTRNLPAKPILQDKAAEPSSRCTRKATLLRQLLMR
jgi:hypothetical protein